MGAVIDRSMKALALRYPEAFVKVALPGMEGLSVEAIENPEVNVPEKRLDFVYKVSSRDGERLLHLEFQLEHESDLPKRMFTYNALLTESQKAPVISAVIYLERRDYAALPDEYAVTLEGRALNAFSYQVVRLWDYEEEIQAGNMPEFAPLLPMLARKKDEEVLSKTREQIGRAHL